MPLYRLVPSSEPDDLEHEGSWSADEATVCEVLWHRLRRSTFPGLDGSPRYSSSLRELTQESQKVRDESLIDTQVASSSRPRVTREVLRRHLDCCSARAFAVKPSCLGRLAAYATTPRGLWGLTAQRGRSKGATMPLYGSEWPPRTPPSGPLL